MWNEEHQCLVDYMGLPLTKTEVRNLKALCSQHLKRSEIQLAASKNAIMEKDHPRMAEQMKAHAEDMQ